MKFQSVALLACSLLAQSTIAYQPKLRKSEGVEGCFEKCGKNAEKSTKIIECQDKCVDESTMAGSTRSSLGPNGADDLLTCGVGCANDAEKKYKKESKGEKCKCDKEAEDYDDCKKACKDDEKQVKKDAQSATEKEYKKCNQRCFKDKSFPSFKFASALKPYLHAYEEDPVQKCFKDCGKKADDSKKVVECQTTCVDESGEDRALIGPSGADELLACGVSCANEAEKQYDKDMKESGVKDCKKLCPEGDGKEECEKACKEAEKIAESEAEKEAKGKYEKCNKKCFQSGTHFKLGYVA